jgi:hypothetical protein
MSTEEYRTIRNQVQGLSTEEQFRLLEDLVAMLKKKSRPRHSILELEGLGKEIWEGVDVDEYIRQSRGSHEPENDEEKNSSSSQNFRQPTSDYVQEYEQVELQIRNIAEEIVQKMELVNTENRDSQAWNSLTESMCQMLNSLRHARNAAVHPSMQDRDIGEKITLERDSWDG